MRRGCSRRSSSSHLVSLRAPDRAGAADRAFAAGAAQPHARASLLDAPAARNALPQLAAGRARQPSRAHRHAREERSLRGGRRPRARSRGVQPLRLLPRRIRTRVALRLRRRMVSGHPSLSGNAVRAAAAGRLHGRPRYRAARDEPLPGGREPRGAARGEVRDPHGAGRADPGRDALAGARIVPRLRLVAGAGAAAARRRRALRLGLPGAAASRRRAGGRADQAGRGLHGPARLVRMLRARRGLDRPRPHLGAAGGRGAHSAGGGAEPGLGCTDLGRGGGVRERARLHHERHAHRRSRARDEALLGRAMARDPRTRRRRRRHAALARRAPERRR